MNSCAIRMCAVGILLFSCVRSHAATWKVELVDAEGSGTFSSLKLDDRGNAHLAYVVGDGRGYPLKYAFRDSVLNRWFVMKIATGASFCSLTLDSKNHPHISFADFGTASGSKVRYAHWDGNLWNLEAIPLNSDVVGYFTSIGLDRDDRPAISFYEYRGPKGTDFKDRLRVVRREGQVWSVETVDGDEGSGKFNSLAVDQRGVIHVAYANVGAAKASMRYASWNGKWNLELIDGRAQNNGESVGFSTALILDKDGTPHVTYMNESRNILKYAVRRNGRWEIELVDQLVKMGYPDRNSIALDEEGRPYIGYYDAGRGALKLAHREGGKWVTEIVDNNSAGYTSSLQIHDGVIWVSYTDEANHGVKVAHAEIGRTDAPAPSQGAANPKTVAGKRP